MNPRVALIALAGALAVGSAALLEHRRSLREQLAEIESARAAAVDSTADALLATEVDRIRLALEGARSQPARNAEAHLALALSDGVLTLERGDIVFRTATVQADVPRGVHPVERVEERLIALAGGITLRPGVADSATVGRGEIRIPRADFDAIRPNLRPGQSAYFF